MNRIHIVGVNPRTGTTLMAECMRLCFDIACWEPHEASLRRLRRCKGVYLTKTPYEIEHVGMRLRLDPRFHVICMVRDPRDVVVSRHGGQPDKYWRHTSLRLFRARWAIAQQWLDHPRFMLVRFEDLIEQPDRVQERIAARFPFLVRTGDFSSFHQRGDVSEPSRLALNGVRPIDAANRAKWRSHATRLEQQLQESGPIDAELLALGYETDADWTTRHGIAADPAIVPRPVRPKGGFRRRAAVAVSAMLAGLFARLGINIG
ncbi:MAG: sulfotransferase [Devosia sp.]